MSRLHRIAVAGEGVKGWTGVEQLAGCDVFVGPNGAGKSTRLLAVVAALRGLAQSPGDAVKVWLGPARPETIISLAFADRTVERSLAVVGGKAAARAEIDAERLAGAHVVRWDLADFAVGSDTARETLIRRCVGAAGASAADAVQILDLELAKAEGGITPAVATVRAELTKAVPVSGAAGAWVEAGIAWAREAFTAANAAARQAEADATAKSGKEGGAAPVGSLADARAEVARLEAELQTISADIGRAESAAQALRSHQAQGDQLVKACAAAEDRLEAQRQRRPAPVPSVDDAAAQSAIAAHDTAQGAIPAREASLAEAFARVQALQAALTDAERACGAADGAYKALLPLAEGASGACRHCGCEDPLGLQVKLAAAREACARTAEAREAAKESLEEAKTDHALAQGALRRAREAASAAQATRTQALAALDRAKADAARIARENAALATELAAAETAAREAAEALAAWQAQPVRGPTGGLDSVQARRTIAQADLAAAKRAVEVHAGYAERQRAAQQAIATREERAAALAAVKAVGLALKEAQAALAAQAFGPITERANALLMVSASPLRVSFRSVSDYGADTPAGFVHFAALSDAERAIVGAAVAYALISLSGAPWRGLILDGLERVDKRNLAGLLHGLGEMVMRGELDNVIGAVQSSEALADVDGVTFHYLGAVAQSEAA